ncbi:MAG: amino acid adenylation domain-containing protein [Actinomycetota bacterium]
MAPVLPSLLGDSAERFADKPAFRFAATDLSYGNLVQRSNQLAYGLRTDGIQTGDLVGVLMGKSVDNAVAVFGIMAAGAAYVPLDPSAPVARLEQIAESCNLSHFVVDDERAGKMAKLADKLSRTCHVYGTTALDGGSVVTAGWEQVATNPTTTPNHTVGQDDLAYIIFTSGSTGTPKGIMHTHGSAVAYADMAAKLYDVTPEDRLSNFPPLHFDQSTFDFFSSTLAGATTVMIGKEHQLVPASLSKLIEDERLTIWYSVPRALVQLLLYGALEERDCSSLRWVVYGGEPFPLKHLDALMARWPNARFSNCYGPAETNQCTYHHFHRTDIDAATDTETGMPIGVACPGMETLVLDRDDNPVTDGEIGELVVNSPTTMKGYWGREDLQDKIFHQRPADDGLRRYYRTGDLARVNQAGLLEFLGRRDRQIKIRGFRVELDEVESVLLTHNDVSEVAVLATSPAGDAGDDDGPTITAYVATGPEVTIDPAKLQRHCATRLPRYAVPGRVRFVDDFPRTTSGKIDYLALAKQEEPA